MASKAYQAALGEAYYIFLLRELRPSVVAIITHPLALVFWLMMTLVAIYHTVMHVVHTLTAR